MNWSDILRNKPLYLNLGGRLNHHPTKYYENYISVDTYLTTGEYEIKHDLRTPIPLPNNSVDRLHTEDFLQYLTIEDINKLLKECFRLLKPGGFMRVGVPDYNNPKDQEYNTKGKDPRWPDHKTLTTYDLMRNIVKNSPFSKYKFYHYWDDGKFIRHKVDYSLGMIKRTPDNDIRDKEPNKELYVTSIVIDLFK